MERRLCWIWNLAILLAGCIGSGPELGTELAGKCASAESAVTTLRNAAVLVCSTPASRAEHAQDCELVDMLVERVDESIDRGDCVRVMALAEALRRAERALSRHGMPDDEPDQPDAGAPDRPPRGEVSEQ